MRPLLFLCASLLGCANQGPPLSEPAVRGKQVYDTTCIACHNADPKRPGAIGPAIQGSSRELLEARLLRAEYPPGYTPKAETKTMPALPQLAGSLDDLTAYLAAP